MNRLRSIVENLEGTLNVLEGEGEEEVTQPGVPAPEPEGEGEEGESEDPPAEEPAEEPPAEEPPAEESDDEATESVLQAIGSEAALYLFGKQLDRYPSIEDGQFEEAVVSDVVAPFLESFHTLTRPLYESKEPTVYREHIELAAALYVLSEMAGADYDAVLEMDASGYSTLIAEACKAQGLDEALPLIPAAGAALRAVGAGAARGAAAVGRGALKLAKGTVSAGKKVVGAAVSGAKKAGGAALKAGGRAAKTMGKEMAYSAGQGAVDRAAQKAKAAVRGESLSQRVNRVLEASAKGDMQYSKHGLTGTPKHAKDKYKQDRGEASDFAGNGYSKNYPSKKVGGMKERGSGYGDKGTPSYPKGQQDRHPGRGTKAT
jgi:hypothetical protein